MHFDIREGSPLEAYKVACEIPEFGNQAYNLEEYKRRLIDPHLVLIGYHQQEAVGFKAGYQRGPDHYFYSWMGGVVPGYRNTGLATQLAKEQERWAKAQGFKTVWFKTRNQNRAMLHFAIKRGFYITEVQAKSDIRYHRIILEKTL